MLSRALSLAAVTLLVGCLTAGALRAAENLEAGKTPSQIFAGTCTACHKSPRGLLKNVPASSLPGFLRQHYTTSSDMASVLASFLMSNGASDTRFQSKDQPKTDGAKGAKEAKPDRRQNPAAAAQEASRPDADGITPQDGGRPGRDAKRTARPGQTPDADKPADGQTPVQAVTDSKAGAKHRHGKRGKPAVEEPPKSDDAAKDTAKDTAKEDTKHETAKVDAGEKPEAAKPTGEGKPDAGTPDTAKSDTAKSDASKSDTAKSDTGKSDTSKSDTGKPDTAKSDTGKPETGKSETAKVDPAKETGGSEPTAPRPDPVPPVTPAPPAPATTASGTPEPAASPSPPATPAAAPAPPTPPAITASAPPPPTVAPAGPPAPPISQ